MVIKILTGNRLLIDIFAKLVYLLDGDYTGDR